MYLLPYRDIQSTYGGEKTRAYTYRRCYLYGTVVFSDLTISTSRTLLYISYIAQMVSWI